MNRNSYKNSSSHPACFLRRMLAAACFIAFESVTASTTQDVLGQLALVNSYFQRSTPVANNDWTGGTYMIGNMAHYRYVGQPRWATDLPSVTSFCVVLRKMRPCWRMRCIGVTHIAGFQRAIADATAVWAVLTISFVVRVMQRSLRPHTKRIQRC